jgi:DsbC/DsbD-like thiol-disulfide interchange protein
MRPAVLTAVLALCAQPAFAGATAWQEVAPGVSVRLISGGDVTADGHTLVGLEIDMPETTKTYWRVPGETGIPTQVDVSRSHGISGHRVRWPYPTIDKQSGYLDYAYFGPTVLPIELQLSGETADLELSATLGVCDEICIPVQVRFEMTLGGEIADRANGLRLRQALAMAPIAWDGGEPPVGSVRYDAGENAVVVDIDTSNIDPASLIGALPDGLPLLGAAQPAPNGRSVHLPVIGSDEAMAATLMGQPMDLVFQTDMGPYLLTRRIGP